VNGSAGSIVLTTSEEYPDLWTYTDQAGWEFTFFGFTDVSGDAAGQIWKIEAPSGELAYVGDASLANDPITQRIRIRRRAHCRTNSLLVARGRRGRLADTEPRSRSYSSG